MPKDYLGNTIKVNSKIVYAHRRGSVLMLKQAVVTAIEEDGEGYVLVGYNPTRVDQRMIRFKSLNNCVVVN